MSRRPPAPPPDLPGFRPLQHLGSGGFADVYLYEQDLPRRRVAVKVLVDRVVSDDVRRRFVSEANAMAQLSAHPSIVTIYQAGVAPDGRLYLVMEYCSRPNLAVRFRREQIPVAEALQIGVRLASAVETAHQAGILHRDIKPANVLVTDYGWPALTDFGIAAQIETSAEQAAGLSLLWAAPELFDSEPRSDRRTDVYALGATVYALLAGRSPFEVPGDNSAAAVVGRIERAPVPSTGRMDSSPQLEQVLARAMHKRAEARPRSALELAQALQGIERQLGFPPTSIDVRDSLVSGPVGDEAEETRVRGVITIDEDPSSRRPSATGWSGGTAQPPAEEEPQRSPLGLVLGLVAAVAVVGVVVGVLVFGPDPEPGAGPSASAAAPTDVLPPVVPVAPDDVECSLEGDELGCAWTPVEGEGVRYRWAFQERPAESTTVETPRFAAQVPEGVTPCVSVQTLVSGRTSDPVVRCAA
ncbi:protein kinase [Auraticoccus sp. F435]|uniref:non-specific serine/threonine protein kinase n=1 Tax=Auraticoccus cholistanensis TaxID=2656650 RepID=A0A6A9UVL9_9ACTN|nr:serine/threonine-protein kinase [Auraticoccus cholistanensis]MVA75257.1 protein kinase [Auraticoccus cholistanensis]